MHRIVSALGGAFLVLAVSASAGAQSMPDRSARPQVQQGFGSTVAVAEGRVIVGEPANQTTPGYVYTYEKDGSGAWQRTSRLEGPAAAEGDQFGRVLAVDGDVMATAATTGDAQATVYVYTRDGSEWKLQQSIEAPADASAAEFGRAVALSGDNLLVGAWAAADSAGAVYAYRRSGSGEFASVGTLTAADSAAGQARFGSSMTVAGDVALIGAPWADGQTGAVYLFRAGDAGWKKEAKLESREVEQGDRFGSSLLLSDGTAFVGTERVNRFVGAVFAFEQDEDSGDWDESYTLQPFDAVQQTRFGMNMAAVDGELWIGAMGVNSFAGAVYRFERGEDGGWQAAEKLTADDLASSDVFGIRFDAEGDLAAIAAPNSDFGLGSVYVFERNADGDWTTDQELYTQPSEMAAVTGNQVQCTSGEAAGFQCEGMDLEAFIPVDQLGGGRGVNLNDIWGWTDPETGHEWALVGRMDGTTFVDVTNPQNPVIVANLPMTKGARANAWRDIKTYKNHAYIVADGAGPHGMQIYDLTQLRDLAPGPDGPVTVEETAHYDNVASVHNIVINPETGYAYAVGAGQGGETCGGGLHMIDIRDPENPQFAGCFSDTSTGRQKTGYTHDAQCVVYNGPDQDYQGHEICLGSNETALSIADVTDKSNPVAISMATYPNVGYTHQGWFDEDQRYFYLDDELDEMQGLVDHTRTLVWDLTDLDEPVLVKEHMGTQSTIDHNLYVKGNFMYQSNYTSGLRVLDITDRENPEETAYFDTTPYDDNEAQFAGSWSNYPYFESGTIVVTSISDGLFVLKKQEGRPVS
ncbi:MAG: choice-of-anchor B family protein [Gemmatimonadales bacterium]|jgi:choice-of-anchor B domain-containing protein